MNTSTKSRNALAALWRHAGQHDAALEAIDLTGAEPVLPSTFAVGTAAQSTIAASALAASELWRLRTGRQQRVSVSMRDAAIEFRSERYLRIAGKPAPELWDKIAGLYCVAVPSSLTADHDFSRADLVLSSLSERSFGEVGVLAGGGGRRP